MTPFQGYFIESPPNPGFRFAAPWAIEYDPFGVREPQWLGTKFTFRRKGEAMKGG
jgi:hypothetical protein